MTKLAAAKVSRSGRTARTWNDETNKVELGTEEDSLELKFSLSSKGGGITDVKIAIGPEDFAALIAAMVSADRGRATREMAAKLASELAKQPDYDRVTARKARESVTKAARRAYEQAPEGRDHAERLTRDMVGQLVEQLNKSDEDESTQESDAA
jgi:hypothetical protein